MAKKIILVTILLLFVVAGSFVFRSVPMIKESEALLAPGVVAKIYTSGEKDIAFELEGDSRVFYINRGEERGLETAQLQSLLIGKEVVLKYPDYWTPLDWNNQTRHLAGVEFEGRLIFSEFTDKSP